MIENDVTMDDVINILENGIVVRKRAKGIEERWLREGKTIAIVTVQDYEEYWLIRHVGRISASKKKLRQMRGA